MSRQPDGSPEVRAQLEQLSHALVNKLLHEPSRRLRAASGPDGLARTDAARHLFGLADEDPSEPSDHPA